MGHLVTHIKALTCVIKIIWRTTSHTTSTMQKPKQILQIYLISAPAAHVWSECYHFTIPYLTFFRIERLLWMVAKSCTTWSGRNPIILQTIYKPSSSARSGDFGWQPTNQPWKSSEKPSIHLWFGSCQASSPQLRNSWKKWCLAKGEAKRGLMWHGEN